MRIIKLIDTAIQAAILAGIKIREIYTTTDFNVELKYDLSPLTKADLQSNAIIQKFLEQTELPILSEESRQVEFQERKAWNYFWLVDPLDGTKEFIKRNDEFTVNIALIHKNQPVAGVIYVPVTGELFAGISGEGAWKLQNPTENCTFQFMQNSGAKLPKQKTTAKFAVAVSRSHRSPETEAYLDKLRLEHGEYELINRGSSLKICMVAEGTADICPRFGPTMEWDTAAGHALVKASGKNIYHTDLQSELTYNKESLFNPHFIVR